MGNEDCDYVYRIIKTEDYLPSIITFLNYRLFRNIFNIPVNPNVAKAGGLQSQGVKGEIVVGYLDPLTTQDLKFSGFPEG